MHFQLLWKCIELSQVMHFQILKTLHINSSCSRFDHLILEVQNIGSKMHFQSKVYMVLEVHKIRSKMHFQPEVHVLVNIVLEVHKIWSKLHFQPKVSLYGTGSA